MSCLLQGLVGITRNIAVQVRGMDGIWKEIHLTRNVKALVLLNLQSYGGGRDLWGVSKARTKNPQRRWQAPIFDDGLIEVHPTSSPRPARSLLVAFSGLSEGQLDMELPVVC